MTTFSEALNENVIFHQNNKILFEMSIPRLLLNEFGFYQNVEKIKLSHATKELLEKKNNESSACH